MEHISQGLGKRNARDSSTSSSTDETGAIDHRSVRPRTSQSMEKEEKQVSAVARDSLDFSATMHKIAELKQEISKKISPDDYADDVSDSRCYC